MYADEDPQYFMKYILPWALEPERVGVSKAVATYHKWAELVEEHGVAQNISKNTEEGVPSMPVEAAWTRTQITDKYVFYPSCE